MTDHDTFNRLVELGAFLRPGDLAVVEHVHVHSEGLPKEHVDVYKQIAPRMLSLDGMLFLCAWNQLGFHSPV